MVYLPLLAIPHQALVVREIDSQTRDIGLTLHGSSVPETSLRGVLAARVGIDLESSRGIREFDSGLAVNPLRDFGKCFVQECFIHVRAVEQRKIQVLGEAIRLEVAF